LWFFKVLLGLIYFILDIYKFLSYPYNIIQVKDEEHYN
jgi:hypothetical protein